MEQKQHRLKSYVLWAAVSALIGMFLGDINVIDAEVYDKYVTKILYILVLAGVINNPTVKDKL